MTTPAPPAPSASYRTRPTRQLARRILARAVGARRPFTFGTRQIVALAGGDAGGGGGGRTGGLGGGGGGGGSAGGWAGGTQVAEDGDPDAFSRYTEPEPEAT